MRCPPHAASLSRRVPFGMREPEIHLRAEGPRVDPPVRARRAKAREHLPSYRDLASRNPQTEPALTVLIVRAISRTVSPSLRSCPASGGASSFLLASALFFPTKRSCDLSVDKTRDASDQLLPPERSTCTRTSCVPGSLRGFHRVDSREVLGFERLTGGPSVSRHS
jgi:hypothetical protein